MANSYTRAGVDVEAGYDTVRLIKDSTKATFDKNVLSNIGGFGGFYTLADYANTGEEPVLVSGTDVRQRYRMSWGEAADLPGLSGGGQALP